MIDDLSSLLPFFSKCGFQSLDRNDDRIRRTEMRVVKRVMRRRESSFKEQKMEGMSEGKESRENERERRKEENDRERQRKEENEVTKSSSSSSSIECSTESYFDFYSLQIS